jgi:hypothetical protein
LLPSYSFGTKDLLHIRLEELYIQHFNHLFTIPKDLYLDMTVVEIGLMGVKPDHDVLNPKTPEGQVLDLAWSTVTTAPGGPYWAYGGVEPDDTLRLWCFFCFDDVKHHMNFAKT